MPALVLKHGREKSLLRRHPWIFSGAVHRVEGEPGLGGTVDLQSSDGQFLARAAYSPQSQIRARVWSFEDETIDAEFFRRRVRAAVQSRASLGFTLDSGERKQATDFPPRPAQETDSWRLLNAESDGLPGVIVDRYGDTLVMQCLTAGAEFWRGTLAEILLEQTGAKTLFERSDADVRELEGLAPRTGWLRGEAADIVEIFEHGLRFKVDLLRGHKTGFYLDQRANRQRLRAVASGRQVLDCFCYSGGFALNALKGGAESVVAVDSSADALALAAENLRVNGLAGARVELKEADVFQQLRKFRDEGRSFDLIVMDPPRFAPTAAHAEKAARAYKDINLLAFKLLRRGGYLMTYSCSGGIDALLFQRIVASAALDAGVEAQIIEHLSQAADHPIALSFPEALYLKGLVLVKTSGS